MPFSNPPPLAKIGSILRIVAVSFVSLALAMVSALLMAFIQYQDRLVKAQPRVTTAQLMSDVQAEDALKDIFHKIDEQALPRISTGTAFAMALSERDQRATRLCANTVFDTEHDPQDKRRANCLPFLNNIPFDRATPGPDHSGINTEDLQLIKARFVEQVITRPSNQGTLDWLRLFDNDFRKIAQLNLELVGYSSALAIAEQALQESCRSALYISRAIRYRTVDLGNCNAVLMRETQLAALSSAPPLPVAEGSRETPPPERTGRPAQSATPRPALAAGGPLPNSGQALMPGTSLGVAAATDTSPAESQVEFELVDHYRFYKGIRWLNAEHLLLSPGEFLILMLVAVSGMMGAFLKMVYAAFSTGKDPKLREIFLEPVLGVICALTIYILLRAGFLVLSDPTRSNGASSLSPFVVAFVSMGGGLASERAMVLFRTSLNSLMGIDEIAQRPRYAVGLEAQLAATQLPVEDFAREIGVAPDLVARWIGQDDTVPANLQRDIGLVLKCSPRRLFTDLPPFDAQA